MHAHPSTEQITILERIPSGDAVTYLVPSDRDPETAYSLVVVRGRPLSCTCLGFVHYQRACKHMRALADRLTAERCVICGVPSVQLCKSGWCPRCCSSDDAHKAKGRVA